MLKNIATTIVIGFASANSDLIHGVTMKERPRNMADPFEYQPEDVTTMKFTGNKSFSVKLKEIVKPIDESEDKRKAPVVGKAKKSWSQSFMDQFKFLMPMGLSADLSNRTLVNAMDIEYVMSLYMGVNYEPLVVVPDTGSTWLVLEGHTCTTCLGTTYDYSDDTTTFVQTSTTTEERNYGSVRTKGFQATDDVCLTDQDSTTCVADFQLFIITEQTGIASNIDGIWGMASGLDTTTGNTGPILMDAFKSANLITDKIFAFGLKLNATGTSFLDFGVINSSAMRLSSELIYIPAITSYWWSNYVNGIKFGAGQNLTDAFTFSTANKTPGFSDSGATCTYIPSVYYNTIINKILEKATAWSQHSTWGYIVNCSDATLLDPIQFYYNDVWLEIQPADYLLDVGTVAGQVCSLCMFESTITENNMNYWLFGNNFMRGFYSVFDMDNSQFGFAPLVGSTKTAPGQAAAYGGEPTYLMVENADAPGATDYCEGKNCDEDGDNKSGGGFEWGWILLGVGAVVVIVVIIVIVMNGKANAEESAEGERARKAYKEKVEMENKEKQKGKDKIDSTDPAAPVETDPIEDPINENTEDFTWDEPTDGPEEVEEDPNAEFQVDDVPTNDFHSMKKHILNLISKKKNAKQTKNKSLNIVML